MSAVAQSSTVLFGNVTSWRAMLGLDSRYGMLNRTVIRTDTVSSVVLCRARSCHATLRCHDRQGRPFDMHWYVLEASWGPFGVLLGPLLRRPCILVGPLGGLVGAS
eukprot:6655220-Pyramimonas_sp.AAC.1